MENIQFKYDKNFLVAVFQDSTEIINYQLEMLTNNEIQNVIHANKQIKNGTVHIYYDITSKLSFEQAITHKKITLDQFLNFLFSFIKACKELEEYQLEQDGILLDVKYIYVNPVNFEADFVYLPNTKGGDSFEKQMVMLKNILMSGSVELLDGQRVQQLVDIFMQNFEQIQTFENKLAEVLKTSTKPQYKAPPSAPPENVSHYLPEQPAPREQPTPKEQAVPKMSITPPVAKKPIPDMPVASVDRIATKGKPAVNMRGMVIVAGVTVVGIGLIFALMRMGIFATETGGTDMTSVGLLAILVLVADYFAYKKLGQTGSAKAEAAATKEKPTKKSAPTVKKGIDNIVYPKVELSKVSENPQPIEIKAETPMAYKPQPLAASNAPSIYDYKTDIIQDDDLFSPYLEHDLNNTREKISLNERFRIGKLVGQVDYISQSKKVSKIHAEFLTKDGRVFVIDLNSLNGTFLNGNRERIQSNIEHEVFNNDRILVADDEFIVRF